MKKRIRSHNYGVTELVGTMLLLLISVGIFSVVYYSVLTIPETTTTPPANIAFSFNTTNITLSHVMGAPLDSETTIMIIIDDETIFKKVEELVNWDDNGNGLWNIGEKLSIPTNKSDLYDTNITINMIDELSNSFISMGTYYHDPVFTPDLTTKITDIAFIQPGPTVLLTAAGDYRLYNVSLSYQYSSDNSTWSEYILFNNDTQFPWEWNFNFPDGTGWYRFKSRGYYNTKSEDSHISADAACLYTLAPVITNTDPSNGETGVPINARLEVELNDGDCVGGCMDLSWFSNVSGSWQKIGSNLSIGNGIYQYDTTSLSLSYETSYYWNVSVTDGISIVESDVFRFTTAAANSPPDEPHSPTPPHEDTEISLDPTLGWSCTDPNGDDVSFDVYIQDSYPPNTKIANNQTTTSIDVGGLSSEVTYYWRVVAWDSNGAKTTGPIWEFTTTLDWTVITYDSFEDDFGNYTDGGYDCHRVSEESFLGSYAARIRDNSGGDSSFYTPSSGIDIHNPGYTSVKIEFYWMYDGDYWYDNEIWNIWFYDGSWNKILEIEPPDDGYAQNTWYKEIIYVNESDYTFQTNARLYFECDASSNYDLVYFDEIYVWAK